MRYLGSMMFVLVRLRHVLWKLDVSRLESLVVPQVGNAEAHCRGVLLVPNFSTTYKINSECCRM